jgi:hypothetical protein
MKAFNNFIKLMGDVMDILPRYLDLSEKDVRTNEEEQELDDIASEIESLKNKITETLPDLSIYENVIESYYSTKKQAEKGDLNAKESYNDMKEIFQAPLEDFLKSSLN